jgi:hypothetical protein
MFLTIPDVDKVREPTSLEIRGVPDKESQALNPEIYTESALKGTDV